MVNGTCASPECEKPRAEKPPTGPQSPYCSRACRDRASYLRTRESSLAKRRAETRANRSEKLCAECGASFVPLNTASQKFCSTACGKRAGNAAWRAGRTACEAKSCENKAIARGLCRKHHPNGADWSRGLVETRRANLRRRTQKRRALTKGDDSAELIDRDEIGARDAWRCGLCGLQVRRTLVYPHPQSASLDHIVPLSLGGKHVRANVQIAHLSCNVAKGNRGGGEQLLLIG